MRFDRHYTGSGRDEFDVTWEPRDAVVRNADGTDRVRYDGCEVPAQWSQNAVDILVTKYFRKAGVPSQVDRVPEVGVPEWLWRCRPALGCTFGRETSARQVFSRIAGCWTYHGWRNGYFDDEESARAFRDEVVYCLAHQLFAPNSPQWFNTGLHWAYGITKSVTGHYRVDPATDQVVEVDDAYSYVQCSACFILESLDNLSEPHGIMDNVVRESRIFALGSGSGTNGSEIRGEGEPLSGGGQSSGFMSFALVADRAAGAIKSGGVTRRAARLVCLDMDHPDIERFIGWKDVEEKKVVSLITGSRVVNRHFQRILRVATLDGGCDPRRNRALRRALLAARQDDVPENYLERALLLARQGVTEYDIPTYDATWDSEAYRTVSGQNANQSVSAQDEFLRCVEQDREWPIYWRTELRKAAAEGRQPRPQRVVRAVDLFDAIAAGAWSSGDPGMLFNTRMNEWHTCPKGGRIHSPNPCGEYHFLDETSCNLASLNAAAFYDAETDTFDVVGYRHVVRLITTALEISIAFGHFPGEALARNTHDYRTLGLGYANVGALLMRMGLAYDGPEGRSVVAALTAILTGTAYETSARMAATLGPFARYRENEADMQRVIRNHWNAAHDTGTYEGLSVPPVPLRRHECRRDLWEAAQVATDDMLHAGQLYGYRNAQVSVLAPTGTISLSMDCDTSGIEPDFSLVKYKTLAGGGMMRVVNGSVGPGLRRLGYDDQQIRDINRYILGSVAVPRINGEAVVSRNAGSWHHVALSDILGGLPEDARQRVEAAIRHVNRVEYAFTRDTLGEDVWSQHDTLDPGFSYLRADGLSDQEIEWLNDDLYGHETIEGAPHIRPEHLGVFDCANKPNKHGSRFLQPESHVLMVAAAQPFVCGGISKTINAPFDATIDDIKRLYMLAWQTGCKCISVFRDRSKLSSPLGSDSPLMDLTDEETAETTVVTTPDKVVGPSDRFVAVSREAAERALEPRHRPLPNRRNSVTQKAKIANQSIFITVGEYDDGTLGEVFLNCYVNGTPVQTLMNVIGRLLSEALQHGVPVEALAEKLLHVRFAPNGVVAGDANIKMASSILDYVGRYLLIHHGGRSDLAHIAPTAAPSRDRLVLVESPEDEVDDDYRWLPESPAAAPTMVAAVRSQLVQYNGEICPQCNQATVRRVGACGWCDTCQDSTGGCG